MLLIAVSFDYSFKSLLSYLHLLVYFNLDVVIQTTVTEAHELALRNLAVFFAEEVGGKRKRVV